MTTPRLPLAAACLGLAVLLSGPAAAQGLGIQPPAPTVRTGPEGVETLAEIAPFIQTHAAVRIAGGLMRVSPTTRDGRHSHGLSMRYYPSLGDCELARQQIYDESNATLCLPIAIPAP